MELSRKLGLRQKTCWYFKRKVMKAMESSGNYLLTGNVDVDEFFVGGQEDGKKGRGKKTKKLVVLAIEKNGKGISVCYRYFIISIISTNVMNAKNITSSFSYLVNTLRKRFMRLNNLSTSFLSLYKSLSYSQGSSLLLFGGTTGEKPCSISNALVWSSLYARSITKLHGSFGFNCSINLRPCGASCFSPAERDKITAVRSFAATK